MNIEPKKPYVYQPYGALTHKERGERLFGVAGVAGADIKGLTKKEAEAICALLNTLGEGEGKASVTREELRKMVATYFNEEWIPEKYVDELVNRLLSKFIITKKEE